MQYTSEINSADIQIALTPIQVRTFQFVHTGIGFGPLMFLLAVLLVYSQSHDIQPSPDSLQLMTIMSIIHTAMALSLYTVASLLYNNHFVGTKLQRAIQNPLIDRQGKPIEATPAEKILNVIRTATILRLALFEGAAFFGLATCMIGTINGALQTKPFYWTNLFSTVVVASLVFITFPTKEKILQLFEEKIKNNTTNLPPTI